MAYEMTWNQLACALMDGDNPIQADGPTEIVDVLQALYSSPGEAEKAYTEDAWAFCERIESELGVQ